MNNLVIEPSQASAAAGGNWSQYLRVVLLAAMLLLGVGAASGVLAEEAPVNINTAAAEELSAALTGVGLAKAQRIVEYREMHGPFEHVDELAEVRGIGSSTVDKNRERIVLE